MARVPLVDREDLPEVHRNIYDDYIRVRGRPPAEIHRALANAPELLRAYMVLSNHLRYGTKLDPRLRELAIVMVGIITGAKYEVAAHSRIALEAGVGQEQLDRLGEFETASVYSLEERAVLSYAAESTRSVHVSDETFDRLRIYFDDDIIVEIVVEVAFYNLVVRILGALAI